MAFLQTVRGEGGGIALQFFFAIYQVHILIFRRHANLTQSSIFQGHMRHWIVNYTGTQSF